MQLLLVTHQQYIYIYLSNNIRRRKYHQVDASSGMVERERKSNENVMCSTTAAAVYL